jgi:catechol 2,3-dioxygenase-like lactoylglutathione lyase family enzyme
VPGPSFDHAPRRHPGICPLCPDPEAAEAFQGGLLGLEPLGKLPGRHDFFKVGTGVLLRFNPAAIEVAIPNVVLPIPTHGACGPGHVCYATCRDEITHWRHRLTAAGLKIEAESDWPNGTRSLYLRDPAGNSVEFAEPWLWDK